MYLSCVGNLNRMSVSAGPASVQTPEEVYDALRRQGYRVTYYRVPLTDGTAPKVLQALIHHFKPFVDD